MIFEGKKYKQYARMQLSKRWALPVLSTALIGIVCTLLQAREALFDSGILVDLGVTQTDNQALLSAKNLFCFLVAFIFTFAQIEVFLALSRSPQKIGASTFIKGFTHWVKAIIGGLWYTLWITLWSMLFFIPGIVKSYSYSAMFFIMVECPKVGATKAMNISKLITANHKADLFILQLSFLPWALLCLLSAGVGFLWLVPYIQQSSVNAYHALLKDALAKGLVTEADLGFSAMNKE